MSTFARVKYVSMRQKHAAKPLSDAACLIQLMHTTRQARCRIRLPEPLYSKLRVSSGDWCVLTEDNGIIRVQRYFASFAPEDVSLVPELLSNRRDEVRREQTADAKAKVSWIGTVQLSVPL